MTLRYEDMPLPEAAMKAGGGVTVSVSCTAERDGWQNAHEPLVTMRVWLGPRGTGMVSMIWAAEIMAASSVDLPVLEMYAGAVHLNTALEKIQSLLAEVLARDSGALTMDSKES